jgi:hypothetical protein
MMEKDFHCELPERGIEEIHEALGMDYSLIIWIFQTRIVMAEDNRDEKNNSGLLFCTGGGGGICQRSE